MDPLSWLLVIWLGVAALIFLFFQKVAEYWPAQQRETQRRVETDQQNYSDFRQKSPIDGQYFPTFELTTDPSLCGAEPSRKPSAPPLIRVTRTPSTLSAQRPTNLALQHESVEWLNQFLAWFFCHYKGRLGFLEAWVKALNDVAKKNSGQSDYEVVFDEVFLIENKTVPRFANFKSEKGPRETLSIRGNFSLPAVGLKCTASRKLHEKTVTSTHTAELSNLNSNVHIRLVCMDTELFCMMCFDGQPSTNIELQQTNILRLQDSPDSSSVEQIIRKCLTGAIVNMTFLEDGISLKSDQKSREASPTSSPSAVECANELLRRLSCAPPPEAGTSWQENTSPLIDQYNRLLVKILRAESLQEIDSFTKPYVIVELDEPAQKHTTSLGASTSPDWEEHFLFDIDQQKSQELLFEVYARSTSVDRRDLAACQQKFLGLAIISVEEIKRSPVTRHELILQSRPFIKDRVSGTLFVECLFVYASSKDHDDEFLLQEFEMHMKHQGGHITTAYANRDDQLLVLKIPELDVKPGIQHRDRTVLNGSTKATRKKFKLSPKSASASASPIPSSKTTTQKPGTETMDGRGRRTAQTSFFGSLKNKLSFKHPPRPKSCDPAVVPPQKILSPTDFTYHPPRSTPSACSVERPSSSQMEVGPGSSDAEHDGEFEIAHPLAILIVELLQNHTKRYYHIPKELASSRRAKETIKAGKKLHVFNGHTFVAVKLPSSSNCKVCLKALTSTFRKQGYQCRDCRIMCHKRCYTKTTHVDCPYSRLSLLEIKTIS